MKYPFVIPALLSLLIAGCATDKTMFYKDGQQVHVLSCSGPTFTGCLEKASNICQSAGYDVLDRASVRQSGIISATEHKELIVACRTKNQGVVLAPSAVAPMNVEAGKSEVKANAPDAPPSSK